MLIGRKACFHGLIINECCFVHAAVASEIGGTPETYKTRKEVNKWINFIL